MRAALSLLLLVACACAGSTTHTETAKTPAAEAAAALPAAPAPGATQATASDPAAPAATEPPTAASAPESASRVDVMTRASEVLKPPDPNAPVKVSTGAGVVDQVDAGEIARSELVAVLSQGVGRFLQRLRTEPHLAGGRFVGWRIVSGVADAGQADGGLQTGDTVLRVNGQSIERPEQFKNVWDSMATESELLLLVERGGKRSQLRYRIIDAR